MTVILKATNPSAKKENPANTNTGSSFSYMSISNNTTSIDIIITTAIITTTITTMMSTTYTSPRAFQLLFTG